LEDGDLVRADDRAYAAMLTAARGIVALRIPNPPPADDDMVAAFKAHFVDTELFFDRFAGGKFARSLFSRHADGPVSGPDAVRELVEESQLFLDAAHQCQIKVAAAAQQEVVA
jgi:sulfite reductase (ferredoxin)